MSHFEFVVVVVLLCSLRTVSRAAVDCTDPCKCTTPVDGQQIEIDIKGIADTFVGQDIPDRSEGKDSGQYNYKVSFCSPMSCNTSDSSVDPTAAVCQYSLPQPGPYYKLGQVDSASWDVTDNDIFSITYTHGRKDKGVIRQVLLSVQVKKSADAHLEYTEEYITGDIEKTHTYIFNMTINKQEEDEDVIRHSSSGGIVGPVGLVLMILLIVGVLTYFIVGSIVMYRVKGARGVEMIPHLSFWKELPILIKDGFMFTISPCRRGKNGYRSL